MLVGTLWLGAVVCSVGAVVATTTQAAAATAPATDAIVPAPLANSQCSTGDASTGDFVDGDCRTDNNALSWYPDSNGDYMLESEDQQVVSWVMENVYEPTALTVTRDSDPTFSGAAETDVVFQERSTNFASNWIGVTYCNDPEDGTAHLCDQTYVNIRGYGDITRISASHEVGHAVGLLHPTRSNPSSDACDASWRVMREAYSCIDSPYLGTMLTNNVNWVY